MDWSLIPFLGEKSTRKRLRELDKELISLVVLISIGFSEVFKEIVELAMLRWPIHWFGVDVTGLAWWTAFTAFWIVVFLVELDQKIAETAQQTAERVDESDRVEF